LLSLVVAVAVMTIEEIAVLAVVVLVVIARHQDLLFLLVLQLL
jgi:hypothetical protein